MKNLINNKHESQIFGGGGGGGGSFFCFEFVCLFCVVLFDHGYYSYSDSKVQCMDWTEIIKCSLYNKTLSKNLKEGLKLFDYGRCLCNYHSFKPKELFCNFRFWPPKTGFCLIEMTFNMLGYISIFFSANFAMPVPV